MLIVVQCVVEVSILSMYCLSLLILVRLTDDTPVSVLLLAHYPAPERKETSQQGGAAHIRLLRISSRLEPFVLLRWRTERILEPSKMAHLVQHSRNPSFQKPSSATTTTTTAPVVITPPRTKTSLLLAHFSTTMMRHQVS